MYLLEKKTLSFNGMFHGGGKAELFFVNTTCEKKISQMVKTTLAGKNQKFFFRNQNWFEPRILICPKKEIA